VSNLSDTLLAWFDDHGRHGLPWQENRTAYRVWVSEIMLQQTQVATVIPYFVRFMQHFPSIGDLASAPIDRVLHLWSGLGYYARGRNLHKTAGVIVEHYGGAFPRNIDALVDLPGIGRSTAGAILALAYGDRHPILDGNVKRVLARLHEVRGWTGSMKVQKELWSYAENHTPEKRLPAYTQAIMDLGATVCVRSHAQCHRCPLTEYCDAFKNGTQARFPERKSRKTLRVKPVKFLLARKSNDELLLWRRPPVGIWGGLWSFPELEETQDVGTWCDRVGMEMSSEIVELPNVMHTFTHFRLSITPLCFQIRPQRNAIMDSDHWLWYNTAQPPRVGLAKPVTTLLGAAFKSTR
jgi:A/G-specific adenine glycosylase